MPHVMSERVVPTGSQMTTEPDLERLRTLLFGKDYQELLVLKRQLKNPQLHSEKVAGVISEALALRIEQDKSLSEVLSPTIENALTDSIERDPKRLANALYPVMGPAIRKSINEVLSQTFETFNQLLEQSLSPKSLLWRFDAWRTGRSYPEVVLLNTLEYQVEQVFLIHRESGLLLRHAVSPQAISKDPDMVSGMLTAIQDFIADSFEVKEGESLSRLRLGELTVLVEQGPHAVIAAVVRGNVPGTLPGLLKETQENVHRQMSNTLMDYEGDSEPFVRIHPLLEKCLLVQTQEKEKRKPWLMYLVLLGLLAGLAYWGYQKYQVYQIEKINEQQWQVAVSRMQNEPGVVIIEAQRQDGRRSIRGLLDPLARHPGKLVNKKAANETDFSFKPYLSAEPEIVLRRAHQVLQPPENVGLALRDGVLAASGNVDVEWRRKLDHSWPNIAGINGLDDSQLRVTDSAKQRLQAMVRQIEAGKHYFDRGETGIPGDNQQMVMQAQRIRQLMKLTTQQGRMLQISVVGNADQTGNEEINTKLAEERAQNVREHLIALGIPGFILNTPGKGVVLKSDRQNGNKVINERFDERSVHYLISLY